MGNKSPWCVPSSDKQQLRLVASWALPSHQRQEDPDAKSKCPSQRHTRRAITLSLSKQVALIGSRDQIQDFERKLMKQPNNL